MQFSASSFAVAMEEAIRVDYLDMRCLARNTFSLDSEHILEASRLPLLLIRQQVRARSIPLRI